LYQTWSSAGELPRRLEVTRWVAKRLSPIKIQRPSVENGTGIGRWVPALWAVPERRLRCRL